MSQIIWNGARKNFLGVKQCTYFTDCRPNKNDQVTSMVLTIVSTVNLSRVVLPNTRPIYITFNNRLLEAYDLNVLRKRAVLYGNSRYTQTFEKKTIIFGRARCWRTVKECLTYPMLKSQFLRRVVCSNSRPIYEVQPIKKCFDNVHVSNKTPFANGREKSRKRRNWTNWTN